jgi:uncharacterized membrane protein
VCILFIIPVSFDWLSQAWRLRDGNNKYRITTGFSEGAGVALLTLTGIPLPFMILIVVIISTSILTLGMYGNPIRNKKLMIKNQQCC